MLTTNTTLINAFKEPARELTGGVRIYAGSTISQTLLPTDTLVSMTINRTAPAGKFFGFAVAQQLTVEVLGKISLAKGTKLGPYLGTKEQNPAILPFFYVDSVTVDETKNKSVIVAYDLIGAADKIAISEIGITYPFTITEFARKIVTALGGNLIADFGSINPVYSDTVPVNLGGTEAARSVLSSIAEATGTIIYCSTADTVVAKALSGEISDSFDGGSYFSFATEDAVTLTQVASGTQLGDNIYIGEAGHTQVIWDNPFLILRDDIADLLELIGSKVIGTTMIPYSLDWRGNPFYEIGDLLEITTVKGEVKEVYYLGDTLVYSGGLKAKSEWEASDSGNIEGSPTSLGETLKQTTARVDKVNNQIELIAKDTAELQEQSARLLIDSENILLEVKTLEQNTQTMVDANQEEMTKLAEKVQTSVSADNLSILVQQELANGVNAVTTTTGFTFDEIGLTISKSGTEMETTITEDGMTIYRDDTAVLVVNNEGVQAEDLHATTYLIIGENSRLEDYNNKTRTGCFWIGN